MGLDKLIKREIGITIATVLLVTTVFIMSSYAIFKVEVSGDTNAITFGDISMSFCADKTCNSTLQNIGNVIGTTQENGITKYVPIYPQADPATTNDWEKLTPYTFTLTNDGTLDLYISLLLTKDTSSDLKYTVDNSYTYEATTTDGISTCPKGGTLNGTNCVIDTSSTYDTQVDDSQIKIAIGEGNNTPTIKLYSATKVEKKDKPGEYEYVIATNILLPATDPKTTKTFHLYAWLKEPEEGATPENCSNWENLCNENSDAEACENKKKCVYNSNQGKFFVTQISVRGEFIPESEEEQEENAESES